MWFASEDSRVVNGYAMISQQIMPERFPSPPSSVQNAKQIALTMGLVLRKGEKIFMKINLKYAFMILFTPCAIRKELQLLITHISDSFACSLDPFLHLGHRTQSLYENVFLVLSQVIMTFSIDTPWRPAIF